MVRLLHIGLTVHEDRWLSKELRKRTIYAEINPNQSDSDIKELFNYHKPELVFMQIQQEKVIGLDLIRYMASKAVLINWSGDVRDPLPSWFYDFDPYCVTCFSNMRDVKQIGGEFLQIGIDSEIFKNRNQSIYTNDLVFMGNRSMCFPLSSYRDQAIEYLRKHFNISVYGGWPGAKDNLMNDQYEESNVYSRSKIAISISHFNIERYFSDRLLRAMGSGCFTISHYYEGIEIDFEVGKHLETFKDFGELKEKCNYYLAHEDERNKIAMAGCKHIHDKFAIENMVDDILKIYEKNKPIH